MGLTRIGCALAIATICFLTSSPSTFAAAYDESVQGDLSGVAATPTAWLLEPGVNSLSGSAYSEWVETTPSVFELVDFDYDLVAFTIPAGHQLDSIVIDSYVNVDELAQSFIGLQAGAPWHNGFGWEINPELLMGYVHLQSWMPVDRTNVLIDIHNINESFDIPLPSGIYTMLLEDVDSFFTYKVDFNVSAIPEPASALLSGLGLTTLVGLRPRFRRTAG